MSYFEGDLIKVEIIKTKFPELVWRQNIRFMEKIK